MTYTPTGGGKSPGERIEGYDNEGTVGDAPPD